MIYTPKPVVDEFSTVVLQAGVEDLLSHERGLSKHGRGAAVLLEVHEDIGAEETLHDGPHLVPHAHDGRLRASRPLWHQVADVSRDPRVDAATETSVRGDGDDQVLCFPLPILHLCTPEQCCNGERER